MSSFHGASASITLSFLYDLACFCCLLFWCGSALSPCLSCIFKLRFMNYSCAASLTVSKLREVFFRQIVWTKRCRRHADDLASSSRPQKLGFQYQHPSPYSQENPGCFHLQPLQCFLPLELHSSPLHMCCYFTLFSSLS